MMTNEEFDRKAAFIVNQQTQFAVDIEKLRLRQDKTEESIDRLVANQAKTDEALIHLAAAQAKTEEVVTRLAYVTNVGFKELDVKIAALVDAQVRNEDRIKDLTESQKQTDEEFRKLMKRLDGRSKNGGKID